jgi:hypothetical protein
MQNMACVTNWNARRAGGRITITGKDVNGEEIKVVGVDVIKPEGDKIVATARDGRKWELIAGNG